MPRRWTPPSAIWRPGPGLSQRPELRLHPQILNRPYPAGLGPPLSVALSTQQKPALDALARRYGAKPGSDQGGHHGHC